VFALVPKGESVGPNSKEDYHFQQNSTHAGRLVICKLAME